MKYNYFVNLCDYYGISKQEFKFIIDGINDIDFKNDVDIDIIVTDTIIELSKLKKSGEYDKYLYKDIFIESLVTSKYYEHNNKIDISININSNKLLLVLILYIEKRNIKLDLSYDELVDIFKCEGYELQYLSDLCERIYLKLNDGDESKDIAVNEVYLREIISELINVTNFESTNDLIIN